MKCCKSYERIHVAHVQKKVGTWLLQQISTTSTKYRYIHFLMTNVLQQQFLYCFIWSAAITT